MEGRTSRISIIVCLGGVDRSRSKMKIINRLQRKKVDREIYGLPDEKSFRTTTTPVAKRTFLSFIAKNKSGRPRSVEEARYVSDYGDEYGDYEEDERELSFPPSFEDYEGVEMAPFVDDEGKQFTRIMTWERAFHKRFREDSEDWVYSTSSVTDLPHR